MNLGLLAVVVLLAVAAASVLWPLRTARRAGALEEGRALALEVARDAKLAELHDLELDFRLGKLSAEDYRALSATLRSEAVEIMRQADASACNGRRAQQRSRGR